MTMWQAFHSLGWRQHLIGWRQHGWRYPFLCVAVANLFHPSWYLRHYPDVAAVGGNAFAHCLLYGITEGRELSPSFSVSGYCYHYSGDALWTPVDAVLHYGWWGRWRGLNPLPCFPGSGLQASAPEQPCLAVFAHSVGPRLYGAERSLLDVLKSLEQLEVATVVVVPNASNPRYIAALQRISRAVYAVPYGWWREGETDHPDTLATLQSLLESTGADAVYLNTLTLQAPAVAARSLGLPVLTHVRELPAYDPGLCLSLHSSAEGVLSHAVAHSDLLIVNSQCTANAFQNKTVQNTALQKKASQQNITDCSDVPITIVPNVVDVSAWQAVAPLNVEQPRPLRIGLLGSLISKKGLDDFAELADLLASKGVTVQCCLFGANTPDLEALLQRRASAGAEGSVCHEGYVEDPRDALATLDVVVNLSHFQESFGRTVLEAMAAARPVVAYEWGALPELVVHGKTGFLAPLGDVQRVAQWIETLANDPALLTSMGNAGRQCANDLFGTKAHRAAMANALSRLFSDVATKID